MKTSSLIPLLVLAAVRVSAAQDCDPPGHIDIASVVENGQIRTGVANFEVDPENPFVVIGSEVWGGVYLEDPLDPFFTNDPGFAALAGSGLPAGSLLGFNVLDDLKYWDGTGPVSFGPVPNGEELRIRLGSQNRYVGTGTGFIDGFNFAVVASDGSVHLHLGFFLHGADGNAVPATQDGVEATPGLYLLEWELKDSSPAVANSDPLYVVFRNGPADCLHCTALNWVGANLAADRPCADLDFDRDVDMDDFGSFQGCATGPTVPWADPCCQDSDLDFDGDIDHEDFGLLQRCLDAPGEPADPACAN